MAARPLPPLQVARGPLAAPEEPAQSSTRIKRSAGLSEDSEAAIQASLGAALDQLDQLELEVPRPRVSPTSLPIPTLPKAMPPLPLPRALPPNMPPLPTAAKRPPPLPAALPTTPLPTAARRPPPLPAALPTTPELLATATLAPVPPPRRGSAKPLAVALLLTLGAGAGALYTTPARAQLGLSQLRAAVTHLLR
jgi:hypothetical protein